MTITYHTEIIQQTPDWYALKCGVLSASLMADIITAKTMKFAENQTCRNLIDEIAIQRITKYIEPSFQGFDMIRGNVEEKLARDLYRKNYAPVEICGFVTNDDFGFTLGWSPDGLVGDDGCIEVKSRKHRLQFATILSGTVPDEYRVQVQTGLLVGRREWCDFISYSGALNMLALKIEPDLELQDAIKNCAFEFEKRVQLAVEEYGNKLASLRIIETEATPETDEIITTNDKE